MGDDATTVYIVLTGEAECDENIGDVTKATEGSTARPGDIFGYGDVSIGNTNTAIGGANPRRRGMCVARLDSEVETIFCLMYSLCFQFRLYASTERILNDST